MKLDMWLTRGDVTACLDLNSEDLTTLPKLPDTLQYLDCSNNKLTSLPDLPPNLKILKCRNNKLTSLPKLPATLETLICSFNKLTKIPDLYQCINLKVLICSYNELTALPPLYNCFALEVLICEYNHIDYITNLYHLEHLCDFIYIPNPISFAPMLPSHLQDPSFIQPFEDGGDVGGIEVVDDEEDVGGIEVVDDEEDVMYESSEDNQTTSIKSIPKYVSDLMIKDAVRKGEVCPILQEPLQEDTSVVTSCHHIFSSGGFADWRKKSGCCPTCREKCVVI